jgi:hypothetical protein
MCNFNSIHINKCQLRITNNFVEFWDERGQVMITKLSIATVKELAKNFRLWVVVISIFDCSDLIGKSLMGALQPFLEGGGSDG